MLQSQLRAQLSFRGCLNPPSDILSRQRHAALLFSYPVLGSSFSPDHFVCGTARRCVTGCFLALTKYTMGEAGDIIFAQWSRMIKKKTPTQFPQ